MFGSELGTVTKVGIKSTRIQSLSREELALSNSVLLKNLIHNYSRRRERRIVFTSGCRHDIEFAIPARKLHAPPAGDARSCASRPPARKHTPARRALTAALGWRRAHADRDHSYT